MPILSKLWTCNDAENLAYSEAVNDEFGPRFIRKFIVFSWMHGITLDWCLKFGSSWWNFKEAGFIQQMSSTDVHKCM